MDPVNAAILAGLPPELAKYFPRYVQIESGGNPNAVTGSYSGLLQMGPDERRRYGGNGLDAGAKMYADKANWFQNTYGRQPSPTELYLTNQQGQGGISAHLSNPDAPAWENMYSTAEGQRRGPNWAQKAIWGNVPDDLKGQFGNVGNLTSQQFMDLWKNKVEYAKNYANAVAAKNGGMAPASPADEAGFAAAYPSASPVMTDAGDDTLPPGATPTAFTGKKTDAGDALGSLGTGLQEAAAYLMSINNPGAGAAMLAAVQGKRNANKLQMGVIGQDEIGNNIYGAFNPMTGQTVPLSALMGAQGASIAGNGTGFGTNGLSDGVQKVRDAVAAGATPTEALKSAPPSVAAIAQAIMEGREPPAQFARNANAMKAATLYAFAADPNLDATKIEERKTFAKSMGSIAPNSFGGEVKMSGTVVQHLATALDQAKAIFGSNFGPGDSGGTMYNGAKMAVGNFLGDPAMKQNYASYQGTAQSLSSELEKLLTNGRPTEGAIRERIKGLALENGPQSVYNALSNIQQLMQGRMDNVAAAKTRAYGVDTDPRSLFTPEAQANYDKVLNNAKSYNEQRSSATSAQPSAPYPGAQLAPDGKWYVKKDGKTYRVD